MGLAKLDDAIARIAALRTDVEDPDGLIRFTLSDDGRLVSLYIADNVGSDADQPCSGGHAEPAVRRR